MSPAQHSGPCIAISKDLTETVATRGKMLSANANGSVLDIVTISTTNTATIPTTGFIATMTSDCGVCSVYISVYEKWRGDKDKLYNVIRSP